MRPHTPHKLGLLRLQIRFNELVLQVKHANYDYILLRRTLVVELPHAVDKVLLLL